MTTLAAPLPEDRGRFSKLTDNDLLEQAMQLAIDIAKNIAELVLVVKELDIRGVSFKDCKLKIIGFCRQIASGKLNPQVPVVFAARPDLITRFARLPMGEQEHLAKGNSVELAVLRDKSTEVRMVDPVDLTADQLRLVFASDHIRPAKEQIPLLEQAALLATRRNDADPDEPSMVEVTVKFSVTEYSLLRRMARKQNLEPHELLHRIVGGQ